MHEFFSLCLGGCSLAPLPLPLKRQMFLLLYESFASFFKTLVFYNTQAAVMFSAACVRRELVNVPFIR